MMLADESSSSSGFLTKKKRLPPKKDKKKGPLARVGKKRVSNLFGNMESDSDEESEKSEEAFKIAHNSIYSHLKIDYLFYKKAIIDLSFLPILLMTMTNPSNRPITW
jgi:hypothetical protein